MNDDTAKFYDKFYSYYPLLNIFLKPYKKRLFQEINKWESGKMLEIDYIVLCHVISVVDNPERLLAECNRVLKENGQIIILNHFTPKNWLRYIDKSFQFLSNFFKFKSLFYLESLKTLSQFSLVSNISLSKLSYFRILIYAKKS